MTDELRDIIGEISEQVRFLGELGVGGLECDLAETELPAVPEQKRTSAEIPREKLEKFIPTEELLRKAVRPSPPEKPKERPRPGGRSNVLDSLRLSNRSAPPPAGRSGAPDAGEVTADKADTVSMTEDNTLKDTLFGDISETLPDADETIEDIRADIGDCTRCPLHEGRTNIVHSTGNRGADLMFVGEAPGADEDAQGEPFVGRAGKLLNKIIEAIGMKREDVFIGNINRCRPPGNRQPTTEEAETCKQFLLREIAVVRPKVIVVLGNTACQNLLETKVGITKLRGNFQDYYGVKVMPTFHPAYLLRDPRKKREVWEDMKKVRDELDRSA